MNLLARWRRTEPVADLTPVFDVNVGRIRDAAARTDHDEEIANLRDDLDATRAELAAMDEVNAELQQALDRERPAPDPALLGQQLKGVWFRPIPGVRMDVDERWARVAATAIDAVRGLWPLEPPAVPSPRDGGDCSGGEEGDGATPGALTGALASAAHTDLARRVQDEHEALARAIAGPDLHVTEQTWDGITDPLREHYRKRADAVLLAGWRPARVPSTAAAVASLLADHALLGDERCRCGWALDTDQSDGDGVPGAIRTQLHHVDHVAQQLVTTGALG